MQSVSLQDSNSMVVCRLRKNNDFRRNNADKATSSKLQAGSGEEGDGGVGEKVAGESDRFSKNCSSSFGSHSLEQIDSAIESNHKQTSDPAIHEPLSREKVSFIIRFQSFFCTWILLI